MEIIVNDYRRIMGMQDEFSKMFPYLKLELYSKSPGVTADFSSKFQLSSSKTLREYRIKHNKSIITITPEITINELRQLFIDTYGLLVRIQRKSGRAWIEASISGGWTLEEQNNQGMALCVKLK